MRNRESSMTSWPRARSNAAVRAPSGSGRVTRSRTPYPNLHNPDPSCGIREEISAGAQLELAPRLGTETNRDDGGTMALRFQHLAAVRLGDQPAKGEAAGGDGRVTRDRRAAGSLEHGEEGALGDERRRGRGVTHGAHKIEGVLVVGARFDGDDPLPHRRQKFV